MIITKQEAAEMSAENKKSNCEWCWHHSYGDCNKCALYVDLKRGRESDE